jgi:hypothetical protein
MTPSLSPTGELIITYSPRETAAILDALKGTPKKSRPCEVCGATVWGNRKACAGCATIKHRKVMAARRQAIKDAEREKVLKQARKNKQQKGRCIACGKPAMTGFKTCGAKMCRLVAAELIRDRMKEMLKGKGSNENKNTKRRA